MSLRLLPRRRSSAPLLFGVARALLAAALFFVPLFFLPGLNDTLELPKSALLLVLTGASACAWLLGNAMEGEVRWRPVPGGRWLASFVTVAALSTFFSVNRTISFLGAAGSMHHAFPVMIGCVLLYLLLVQLLDDERDGSRFVLVAMASFGVGGLLGVLQLGGLSPFGLDELRSSSFIVTGPSATALAVMMALVIPLALTVLRTVKNRIWTVLTYLLCVVAFALLLAIDSFAAWIALLVGIVVVISFANLKEHSRIELALGTATLVIVIAGMLLPTGGVLGNRVENDINLDATTAWKVAAQTVAKFPVIGSGVNTFYYDFVRFRPESFNATPLAPYRFMKASDEGIELLATMGVLGAMTLAGFIGSLLFRAVRIGEPTPRRKRNGWTLLPPLTGVVTGMVASMLFAPSTVTTYAMFWAFAGLAAARTTSTGRTLCMPRAGSRPILMVAFIVVVAVTVSATIWSVRSIMADRELVKASSPVNSEQDLASVSDAIERSISLNPTTALPYLLKAQSLLIKAQLAQQQSPNNPTIRTMVGAAIAAAETAVSKDTQNPAILETLATFYKNLGTVSADTRELVVNAYRRAIAAEPSNARLHLALGQAYYLITSSDAAEKNADQSSIKAGLVNARAEFETVNRMLPNSLDAGYGLVLVDELAGEKDRAYETLQKLVATNNNSAPLWHELGLRFVERNEIDRAKEAFSASVELEPSSPRPHWQLGLIAETQKDYATAREEFSTVKELDPTNTDVDKKLESLPKD